MNKAMRQLGYGVFVLFNSIILKYESLKIVEFFSSGDTSPMGLLAEFPVELLAGLGIGTPTLGVGVLMGLGFHKLAQSWDDKPGGINNVNLQSKSFVADYYGDETQTRKRTIKLAESMLNLQAGPSSSSMQSNIQPSSGSSSTDAAVENSSTIKGKAPAIFRHLKQISQNPQTPMLAFAVEKMGDDDKEDDNYKVTFRPISSLDDIKPTGELLFPPSISDIEESRIMLNIQTEEIAGHEVSDAQLAAARQDEMVDERGAIIPRSLSFSRSRGASVASNSGTGYVPVKEEDVVAPLTT